MTVLWIALGFFLGALVASILARAVVHRSVTRVHAAQRRAQRAERLAEIGSMTSGLAHEIKNPLSTIGLNAQLLSESVEDLDISEQDRGRLTRRLTALRHETERLKGILEDFLGFAGELRISFAETDINKMVAELADFYEPQAQNAGVRMRVDLSPQNPSAMIDAPHIKQAMLNLMLNAVNAMESIESSSHELILRTATSIDAETREPMIHLHITDTGPGIDEETRRRVFHPYFTTRSGGTGLGLSIARRIVEAHHGHIELHTEVGKGSDFSIVLPSSQPSAPASQ
jgi:signal transduction histidine kinase